MRKLLVWAWAAGLGCAASDDVTVWDVPRGDDGAGDVGPDADADADDDAPVGEDGGLPGDDAGTPDDVAAEDAAPAEPVCRYECSGDDACATAYGAGWVCREVSLVARRSCLQLCAGDADCRYGVASDVLMVCREGACGMRPCAGDGECGWAGAGAACRTADFGTVSACQRGCGSDADCRTTGTASDLLYHCDGGVCAWYCETDTDCRNAFGTDAYGCRLPSYEPGPSCLIGCSSRADCLTGAPSDALVDCR